jgi:hypothetical protein
MKRLLPSCCKTKPLGSVSCCNSCATIVSCVSVHDQFKSLFPVLWNRWNGTGFLCVWPVLRTLLPNVTRRESEYTAVTLRVASGRNKERTHMLAGRPYILARIDGRVEVRHRRRYWSVPGAPGFIGHLQQRQRLCCRLGTQRVVLLDVAHPIVFLIHPFCKESLINRPFHTGAPLTQETVSTRCSEKHATVSRYGVFTVFYGTEAYDTWKNAHFAGEWVSECERVRENGWQWVSESMCVYMCMAYHLFRKVTSGKNHRSSSK